MKRIYTFLLGFAALLAVAGIAVSCGISSSEDPEYPLCVSYTVSAGEVSFTGPDQLLIDMKAWIKANQQVYDVQVKYSTGDPSEFTKTDAEAIRKYEEEFLPKFKSHLNEVIAELDKGSYGKSATVKATFYTFASRLQGKQGDLRYEHIELNYPVGGQ